MTQNESMSPLRALRWECDCGQARKAHEDGDACTHEDLAAVVIDVDETRRLEMVAALATLFHRVDLLDRDSRSEARKAAAQSLQMIRTMCGSRS